MKIRLKDGGCLSDMISGDVPGSEQVIGALDGKYKFRYTYPFTGQPIDFVHRLGSFHTLRDILLFVSDDYARIYRENEHHRYENSVRVFGCPIEDLKVVGINFNDKIVTFDVTMFS